MSWILLINRSKQLVSIGPLASTGVDGLAFVSTKLVHQNRRTANKDWPDIEMHMVPADVVADGGRYFKHLAGLSEQVGSYLDGSLRPALRPIN